MKDGARVLVIGLRGIGAVQGGVETHATQLYPRIARKGWDVEVVVRRPYLLRGAARDWPALKVTALWSPASKHLEAILHTFLAVLYAAVRRPTVLHVHAIGPALWVPLAKLLGLHVVVTHHGMDYERQKWGRLAKAVLRLGESWGMRFADERIAISTAVARLVQTKYGMPCVVIPNGVDLPNAPVTEETTNRLGVRAGRYFLLVGRLVPEKCHLDLIRAFGAAQFQDWKLVLAGDADHADAYREAVVHTAATTAGILFTGFQSGQALHDLYGNAGGFVLPSSHEGLPIALLEALSYGLPVIVSDIGPHRELRLPEQCYFPVGDTVELTKKLSTLARCRDRWMGAGWDATELLRAFDWDAIAARTVEAYERIATLDR